MTRHPTPPPRTPAHWTVWLLVGVSTFAFLSLLGLFVYLNPPPGSNCNDPWVFCPLGPGATPLGTALAVGDGTGACPAGIGSSLPGCAYSFAISVSTGGLSAAELTFALQDANSSALDATYTVTLLSQESGWVGVWNSSTGAWAPWTAGGACGTADCLSSPLVAGDSFLLKAVPGGGLPYSHRGDQLRIDAVGGGFAGWLEAPID